MGSHWTVNSRASISSCQYTTERKKKSIYGGLKYLMQTKIPKLQLAHRGWPEVLQSAQYLFVGSFKSAFKITWFFSEVLLFCWTADPVVRGRYDMVEFRTWPCDDIEQMRRYYVLDISESPEVLTEGEMSVKWGNRSSRGQRNYIFQIRMTWILCHTR